MIDDVSYNKNIYGLCVDKLAALCRFWSEESIVNAQYHRVNSTM